MPIILFFYAEVAIKWAKLSLTYMKDLIDADTKTRVRDNDQSAFREHVPEVKYSLVQSKQITSDS